MTRAPTPRHLPLLLLLAFVLGGCMTGSHGRKTENLDKSLRVFNQQFESKMIDNILPLVHKEAREAFALESLEFRERVTFYETTPIDFRYYRDDQEMKTTADGPEEGYNRAIAKIRYRFVTLPGNQLRTLVLDQEWVYEDETWFVKPQIKPFLH